MLSKDSEVDEDPPPSALVSGVSYGTLTFNADGNFTKSWAFKIRYAVDSGI
jgi:hypothetical protein